jgi:hypothetical protein
MSALALVQFARGLPKCSHITRKRGVNYYRGHFPSLQVTMSLKTKRYRVAEHIPTLLDTTFGAHVGRPIPTPDLQAILNRYLNDIVDADLEHRKGRPQGPPMYTGPSSPNEDPVDVDLDTIETLLSIAR